VKSIPKSFSFPGRVTATISQTVSANIVGLNWFQGLSHWGGGEAGNAQNLTTSTTSSLAHTVESFGYNCPGRWDVAHIPSTGTITSKSVDNY